MYPWAARLRLDSKGAASDETTEGDDDDLPKQSQLDQRRIRGRTDHRCAVHGGCAAAWCWTGGRRLRLRPGRAGVVDAERAPPYTPAAGAKDLKAVMFNWGWYTGMLRSSEEYDVLMTLDYQGKGTMQVGGQPCNVTMYRSDISYKTSGERIRITGTRPNGQSCSTIEVLSGAYAWNEDIQGAELVPGKGKATPMPATVEERMIRLWSGPQGAFKAAFAGTSGSAVHDAQAAAAGRRCDDDR